MAYKKVFLIRHGKTKGNEEKRYIGCKTDESLSEKGISEIKNRKAELTDIIKTPDRVCAGMSKRTVRTAELLYPEIKTEIIDDLTEIDFGLFEGKNHSELDGNEEYQRWIDSNGNLPFPEGESREAFINRSCKVFNRIIREGKEDERIVIVCHGGNIMSVMKRLTDKDYYDFMTANLCGYILELETEDERIDLVSYNKFDLGSNT